VCLPYEEITVALLGSGLCTSSYVRRFRKRVSSKHVVRQCLTDTANLKQGFSSGARIMTRLQAKRSRNHLSVRGRNKRPFGCQKHSEPVHLVPMALSRGVKSAGLKLTTNQHLKPKSKMGRSITLFDRALAGTVSCIM